MKLKKDTLNNEEKTGLREMVDFKLPMHQCVRTTFRLSQQGHNAIKKLADLQGIKKADVFEMLISLYDGAREKGVDLSSVSRAKIRKTTRRTYVLEKNVLSKLRIITDREKIPRDLFIDKMSILLEGLLDQELSKKQKKYRHIFEKFIKPFWDQSEEIEKKLKEELGEDDPVVDRFGIVVVNVMDFALFLEESL